ncbi:hypothetical protein LOTGIDRAFT_127740 [Lottia gigantea]|uniref:Protein-tyrosine-phosphatase n=1 Tax=Lottia gigantea TaxID=225164 RepID=V3Z9F6_LOTGI|nr:hypothetical protein LOTGIDRAFT_127740 [Lottia gigantea]ESO87548.1 hypothetical protein LOTGIDRAFT_127740 [Lottia gigantea]
MNLTFFIVDDTRVILEPLADDPNSDYINACYITVSYNLMSLYYHIPGPIGVNMEEFIRMIWDVDASKIVMLTNLFENAIEKCKQYWPDIGKTQQFGQIYMKLIKEEVYAHFTIREIQITKDSNSRIFRQYHYTSWPDKGVPSDIASLVEFRNKVNKSSSKRSGPMIVHCSAGIGRTGTYLALDYLIQQAQAENSVDIFSCVSQMRQERVNMVQTLVRSEIYMENMRKII